MVFNLNFKPQGSCFLPLDLNSYCVLNTFLGARKIGFSPHKAYILVGGRSNKSIKSQICIVPPIVINDIRKTERA